MTWQTGLQTGVTTPPGVELPSLLPSTLIDGGRTARGARTVRTVRDWFVDVLCFALAVGVGAVLVFGATHQTPSPADPGLAVADVVAGAVCCLSLWWRRRWPVALALLSLPAGTFSAMSAVAGLILVFTVAVHRRAAVAVPIAGLTLLVGIPYHFVRGDGQPFFYDLGISVLVIAVCLGWGMFTRARRQLVETLRDRAVRAEAEQQLRVDQARQLERARIAREMHDVLAHRISLLSVHAGALEFRTDAGREQVAQTAGVIRATAHQALQDLREVIGVLREDGAAPGDAAAPAGTPERPQPSLAEIPALVSESSDAGAAVGYTCTLAEVGDLPSSIGRTAYRVVQEGLTNARKHAPGLPVDVRVDGAPGADLRVRITNGLAAWPPPAASVPGAGLGLIGLAERVQLGGGRLEHGRRGHDQYVLEASLPWPS